VIKTAPSARISPWADIEDSVRGSQIVIGSGTVIDSFVKIKPAGGNGDLIIGSNCHINSGCVLYTGGGIVIGNNVSVAANCTFAPVNHEYKDRNILIQDQGFCESKGGIIIGDDVWIGANSVLLDGTILGQGVVIGAGSVVRGNFDSYRVFAGNPLRCIGSRK